MEDSYERLGSGSFRCDLCAFGDPAALAAMAVSLLSPWIAVIVMVCASAISYTQACGMLSLITGRSETQLARGKLLCTLISLAVTLTLCGVAGGQMMGGVVQLIFVLFANVGSLI